MTGALPITNPPRQFRTVRLLTGVTTVLAVGTGLAFAVPLSCTPVATGQSSAQSPKDTTAGPPPAADSHKPIQGQAPTNAIEGEPLQTRSQESYADAIRRRQFTRAASLIDNATQSEQKEPEVRYARAIVALELNDVETALRSADGLDVTFPLFKEEAEAIRLMAAKISGDVTLLQHFLESSKSGSDLLLLAEAHEESSSLLKARILADQALGLLEDSKKRNHLELAARAHEIKARSYVSENKKIEAAKEYRWLATKAAPLAGKTLQEGSKAHDVTMLELDPKRDLSQKERLARAQVFSEQGLIELTESEIEKLRALSGPPPSKAQLAHFRAWAVYTARTDYEEASALFAQAAAHGGADRRKNLYYEAKALARSHRDADAIEKYENLSTLGGAFADHAAYQAARLKFIDGRWSSAKNSYVKYLKRFGANALHKTAAQRELPIVRLAAGDFSQAVVELQSLIDSESNPRTRAQYLQLQGVALLGSERNAPAAALFRKVIDYRPLSLPALMAAARLKEMGEALPPLISPTTAVPSASDAKTHLGPLSVSLPEKSWRLSRVGLDAEAELALKKKESEIRREYGSRSGEALCRLYGQLKSAKRRYQIAQTAASWSVLRVQPSATDEWQWDCIYPSPYDDIVEEEAILRQVPTPFVYSIMRQESAFRPTVVSPARAVGLMQIIPTTAERIAGELDTVFIPELMRAPAANIRFGTYYLRRLLDMFGQRPELAAASYNAGPHAVTRWLRAGEKLPLDIFVARIPYKETRNYVYRVMGNYARYAYRNEKTDVPLIDLKLPTGLKATEDAY